MSNIKNLLEKLDTLSKPSNSPSAKKMIKEADGQPSYTGAQVGAKLDRMKDRLERRSPYKTYAETPDFQFTPEQLKWLGNANKKDPSIIARMPSRLGPKPPVSYFAQGADQTRAQQVNYGDQNVARLRGQGREQVRAAGRFPTASGAEQTATGGAVASAVPDSNVNVVTSVPVNAPELKPDYSLPTTARLGGGQAGAATTAPAAPTTPAAPSTPAASTASSTSAASSGSSPAAAMRPPAPTPDVSGNAVINYDDAATQMQGTPMGTGSNYYVPGAGPSSRPMTGGRPAAQPARTSGQQSSLRGSSRNMALNRGSASSNIAETSRNNKHVAAEKLARKYEIYLENRFGIIESNYVPKKKELR